ncbi:MAG: type II toxin-antitoxin system HicA family toxin [Chthoniobacterales bacterium]|nr:type II toxin-antitoxin system HicA family toxin [Chthoniobacterales bacterium]
MKIPRDVSGADLAKALRVLGYEEVRQDGSHMRLTTNVGGQFHVTIPNHQPIKVGTLRGIIKLIAEHHKTTPDELFEQLDL